MRRHNPTVMLPGIDVDVLAYFETGHIVAYHDSEGVWYESFNDVFIPGEPYYWVDLMDIERSLKK